jgi:hypothetical protein
MVLTKSFRESVIEELRDEDSPRTTLREAINDINPYFPGADSPLPELAGRDRIREQVRVAIRCALLKSCAEANQCCISGIHFKNGDR